MAELSRPLYLVLPGVAALDQRLQQIGNLQLVPGPQREQFPLQLLRPQGVLQGGVHAGHNAVALAVLQLGEGLQPQPLVLVGGPRRVPEVEVPQGIGHRAQPQSGQVLAEPLGLRLVGGQHQSPPAGLFAQGGYHTALVHPREPRHRPRDGAPLHRLLQAGVVWPPGQSALDQFHRDSPFLTFCAGGGQLLYRFMALSMSPLAMSSAAAAAFSRAVAKSFCSFSVKRESTQSAKL